MSSPHPSKHREHHPSNGNSNHRSPKRMSAGHVVRLLLLHLTLFITIAAFVVLVTQSFNTFSPHHWAAMSLLVFGAAIAATVVTIRHARSGAWTSVDDMADRF